MVQTATTPLILMEEGRCFLFLIHLPIDITACTNTIPIIPTQLTDHGKSQSSSPRHRHHTYHDLDDNNVTPAPKHSIIKNILIFPPKNMSSYEYVKKNEQSRISHVKVTHVRTLVRIFVLHISNHLEVIQGRTVPLPYGYQVLITSNFCDFIW